MLIILILPLNFSEKKIFSFKFCILVFDKKNMFRQSSDSPKFNGPETVFSAPRHETAEEKKSDVVKVMMIETATCVVNKISSVVIVNKRVQPLRGCPL